MLAVCCAENSVTPEVLGDRAAALLSAALDVWETYGPAAGDRTARLTGQLLGVLRAHETAVLCVETTYEVAPAEAAHAAAVGKQCLESLQSRSQIADHLEAVERATVHLAGLLVRMIGNLKRGGSAADSPSLAPPQLPAMLDRVIADVDAAASPIAAEAPRGADTVGFHLARALRSPLIDPAHDGKAAPVDDALNAEMLEVARRAWVTLAAREYLIIRALDGDLDVSAYRERFGTLECATREGAQNLLLGGRILERRDAFIQRGAWSRQAVSLTHVVDAYTAGLRGVSAAFADTQLVVLTRLVRAVAAIVVLDMQRKA